MHRMSDKDIIKRNMFLLIFAGLLFLVAVLLPLMYILLPKGKTVSIRYYENTLILHPGSIRK